MDGKARKVASIRRDIETHFGFMLQRGFVITLADYSPEMMGAWAVDLRSETCTMHVTNDRSFIGVEFSPAAATSNSDRISLDTLLTKVTEGAVVLQPFRGNLAWGQKKQLQRWAKALEANVDAVLQYFASIADKPRY
jgi:hypothetical protein